MTKRNMLFTDRNWKVIRLHDVDLFGRVLMPPMYIQLNGKLYENKGTALGSTPTNFYREVPAEFIVLQHPEAS